MDGGDMLGLGFVFLLKKKLLDGDKHNAKDDKMRYARVNNKKG